MSCPLTTIINTTLEFRLQPRHNGTKSTRSRFCTFQFKCFWWVLKPTHLGFSEAPYFNRYYYVHSTTHNAALPTCLLWLVNFIESWFSGEPKKFTWSGLWDFKEKFDFDLLKNLAPMCESNDRSHNQAIVISQLLWKAIISTSG